MIGKNHARLQGPGLSAHPCQSFTCLFDNAEGLIKGVLIEMQMIYWLGGQTLGPGFAFPYSSLQHPLISALYADVIDSHKDVGSFSYSDLKAKSLSLKLRLVGAHTRVYWWVLLLHVYVYTCAACVMLWWALLLYEQIVADSPFPYLLFLFVLVFQLLRCFWPSKTLFAILWICFFCSMNI